MANTTTAKKETRKNQRRRVINLRRKRAYTEAKRRLKNEPSQENYQALQKAVDKAAQNKVIKKGTANRIKSRLTALTNTSKEKKSATA